MTQELKNSIRTIPNWPKQGIMFRDITTLLKDPKSFRTVIDLLVQRYIGKDIDLVIGIESRGFILGGALAYQLGKPFVPIRKPGKLPADKVSKEYELEYGKDKIEVHKDAIQAGQKCLIIDDLIATGGTAKAAAELVEQLGGRIFECSFVIDLPDVGGMRRLRDAGYPAYAMLKFEGE